MQHALYFLLGLAVGTLSVAFAARMIVRRSLARVRVAERRARGAEKLAELGAMTSGLAHEIKNPLSTIGLNAQLLGEGIDELGIDADEKSRLSRRLASLRREADRLRGILTDFLEYAGELRLDLARADINDLVSELVDFFQPQAQQQRVRLRADLAPGPLAVMVDAKHVKQALLNLMLNAVQAMAGSDDGSSRPRELILKTHPQRDPDASAMVAIHVIDTGPGISPEALAKLFVPYFTTKAGGTGLGLPTTRRLIEAHHGRIDVHSEVGRGTDFTITLPVEGPTVGASGPGATPA